VKLFAPDLKLLSAGRLCVLFGDCILV
jgi:hypothetical protein